MASLDDEKSGMEAIKKLKSTDPILFLSPSSDLSISSRIASQYLFNSLKPHSLKCPFDQLYTDGFDTEQIWQQIDLQSLPLISSLKREIKRFENNPHQIFDLFGEKGALGGGIKEDGDVGLVENGEELDGLRDDDVDDDDMDGEDEERESEDGEEEGEDDDDDEGDDDCEDEEDDGDGVPEVEDDFLKIKELEKYLVREENRENGDVDELINKKKRKNSNRIGMSEDEDEEDEREMDEDRDELFMYGGGGDDEDGANNIRYEDFFVSNKKMPKKQWKQVDGSDGLEMEEESEDSEREEESEKQEENLSTFEKERLKMQAKIKEMEEANLKPKEWTMQGEVVASKRPKDSALEVDLDFEHNVRPPPVITEEVTASLEEIIKQRITEGNFDDVQRAPTLPSVAPKERKELDDNKSKKGLAEIYEAEYAQQSGLASAPMSFNDELKKEADSLFKRLCLKLDALSHFHFAPKPVIEDLSVQTNIPALAMEEIAPMAVSDAAMLAPEEVFAGKGDVKEETELTKEDRKRRRAKKKRIVKAKKAKITVNRAIEKPSQVQKEGK